MLLKKIPKRSISVHSNLIKDFLFLVCSSFTKDAGLVKKFEDEFRSYVSAKEAIAVSSGRFALCLILKNLGLKKNDKVILSAYNFAGVPKALLEQGFCPVFVDADMNSYQIDISKIEENIDSKTKAIIVTHLFGQPCNLSEVLNIAKKYNLFVIEDAAHSLGSLYHGKHTGTIADAGFFSFSGSKVLNTSFGGMAVINNIDFANKIRSQLPNYKFPRIAGLLRERFITFIYALLSNRTFYTFTEYPLTVFMCLFGLDPLEIYKSLKHTEITEKRMRFTDFQASIGLEQIASLNTLISTRKRAAKIILGRLHKSIILQQIPKNCEPNYFMIPIKTSDKFRVFKKLLFKGIDSNLNYASDCSHLVKNSLMPVAKHLSDRILTINLPFDLSDKDISYLVDVFNTTIS